MKHFKLCLVLLVSVFLTVSCAGLKSNSVATTPVQPQEVIIKVESTDPVTMKIEEDLNPEATVWQHGLNQPESSALLSYLTHITPESVVMNLYAGISVNDFVKISDDLGKIEDFTDYRVIDLNINSPGGSAFDGLSISDLIVKYQGKGFTFRAHASGLIASAAVPIYAVCDERYATTGAIFMVHEAAIFKWPGRETSSDINAQNKMMSILKEQYTSYLVDNSNLSRKEWNKMQEDTTWFTAKEALKFGLVDFIE